MTNFKNKFKDKTQFFVLSLLSKKQVWSIIATIALFKGVVPAEVWFAFICVMQGVDTYEKKAGVKFIPKEED